MNQQLRPRDNIDNIIDKGSDSLLGKLIAVDIIILPFITICMLLINPQYNIIHF